MNIREGKYIKSVYCGLWEKENSGFCVFLPIRQMTSLWRQNVLKLYQIVKLTPKIEYSRGKKHIIGILWPLGEGKLRILFFLPILSNSTLIDINYNVIMTSNSIFENILFAFLDSSLNFLWDRPCHFFYFKVTGKV